MSSFRRIISSRTNGAKSKGPQSEAGKRRSSLNGIRHGLLSKNVLCDLEDRENFDIVVREHAECFQPENGVQEGLIEEMAVAHWKTRRVWALENNMMNHALADTSPEDSHLDRITQAFTKLAEKPGYHLLDIYEGRLHRRYHRAVNTMLALKPVCHHSEETKVTELTQETSLPPVREEKNSGHTNPL
jgi:hypothetical protein